MSNKLSNASVALGLRAFARGASLRKAARSAKTDKGTLHSYLRIIGESCLRSRAGLPGANAHTNHTLRRLWLDASNRSRTLYVSVLRDEHTDLVVDYAFGSSLSEVGAARETHVHALEETSRLHLPIGKATLAAPYSPSDRIAFQVAVWNLCTTIDGLTPAMRSGMTNKPMGVWELWLTLVGARDARSRKEEQVEDGPIVVERPPSPVVIVARTPREIRDAKIMSRDFGRLRVLQIHCYEPNARRPKKPEIEWCLCRCACGAIRRVAWGHLRQGAIQSCGCIHAETIFGATANQPVVVGGQSISIGQAACLAGIKPTSFVARLRRGASANDIVFREKGPTHRDNEDDTCTSPCP